MKPRHPAASACATSRKCALWGLTLIEVLVALAIVSTALVAGVKASGALMGNAERVQVAAYAQWCADNQLTALRLTRQLPPLGTSTVNCEQLGRRFAVEVTVANTPNPNFRRVDFTVRDEALRHLLRFTTILSRD